MKTSIPRLAPRARAAALTACLALLAGAAGAQRLARLELQVTDAGSGATLQPIQPKDVLPIEVGQQVRVRMTAVSGSGVSYPATRFVPNPGQDFLRIVRNDSASGTLEVTGLRPHGPDGAVPIQYTVLDRVPMDDALRSARIYIKVVDRGQSVQTQTATDVSTAPAGGVTLFADDGFRGRSQTFAADDPSLRDNPIGNDSVSSVHVPAGCRATLYQHENYGGRSTVIEGDQASLHDSEVGNDSVSSLRVECGVRVSSSAAAAADQGVVLYSEKGFEGSRLALFGDDDELADNPVLGADQVSSARIAPGCQAWLFEHPNYTGRSYYLTRDMPDLAQTPVGENTVSSVRLRCS
jgi:hypothetical protein